MPNFDPRAAASDLMYAGEPEKANWLTGAATLLGKLNPVSPAYAGEDEDFMSAFGKLVGSKPKGPAEEQVKPPLQIDATPKLENQQSGMGMSELGGRIANTIERLTGRQDALRLNDLRAALPNVPRTKLDEELMSLHRAGKVTLMPLDNPPDIKKVGDAALKSGYTTYHSVFLNR